MPELKTREQLLETVHELRVELARVITEAGPERLDVAGSIGDWSLKDVIAHLTIWRMRTAVRLEAGMTGAEPAAPWPAELEQGDEEAEVDAINNWWYERNRDRPFEQVLRESNDTFERVERALSQLSDDALFTVSRFPWLEGHALGPGVIGGTYDHWYEEHAAPIRAWLDGSRG